MHYSRYDFKCWLKTLPQDQPFCRARNCPIVEFFLAHDEDMDNGRAQLYDPRLTAIIDEAPIDYTSPFLSFPHTPSQVLALITNLEMVESLEHQNDFYRQACKNANVNPFAQDPD